MQADDPVFGHGQRQFARRMRAESLGHRNVADHAAGAGVQHLVDLGEAVATHAHERRSRCAADRMQQPETAIQIDQRVSLVDRHRIETGNTEQLAGDWRGCCNPAADRGSAGTDQFINGIGTDGMLLRAHLPLRRITACTNKRKEPPEKRCADLGRAY